MNFYVAYKISGETDKMPKNESKDKSVWKIKFFSAYLNFEKLFFGYYKSQISKCPSKSEILHHVLASRMHFSLSTEQILLTEYNEHTVACIPDGALKS